MRRSFGVFEAQTRGDFVENDFRSVDVEIFGNVGRVVGDAEVAATHNVLFVAPGADLVGVTAGFVRADTAEDSLEGVTIWNVGTVAR